MQQYREYTAAEALERPALMDVGERAEFLTKTYLHLFGAIAAFVAVEVALFSTGVAATIAAPLLGNWLIALGGFMLVGMVFTSVAHRAKTVPMQYLGLGGYVLADAVLFCPLLYIADHYAPGAIANAAVVTLGSFAGLTMIVFFSRKDFSFLGPFIAFGGAAALVAIVVGAIGGFELGLWFNLAMVVFAGGIVLFKTSALLHSYPANRPVAAALELFAAIALMFWYVLRLFMSRD